MTIGPSRRRSDVRDRERFWKFVDKGAPDECWEWQSTRNKNGYGKFWLEGKTGSAHRTSYRINNGPIPPGAQVRHTCDNPPCVNPAHLLIGSRLDNARDALDRDKYRRGVDNPTAKLTDQSVREIKRCWAQGETQVSLARRFNVSRAAIQWVLKGKSWAHVGDAA